MPVFSKDWPMLTIKCPKLVESMHGSNEVQVATHGVIRNIVSVQEP